VIQATRYHDICAGHRVVGHEGHCRHLHGHNYRIHFTCEANRLDEVGRVIDFGVIKDTLCAWLERNWDHKFLMWMEDPLMDKLLRGAAGKEMGLVGVPFNPTAENLGAYLGEDIAPKLLDQYHVRCVRIVVEETRKCSATWEICR